MSKGRGLGRLSCFRPQLRLKSPCLTSRPGNIAGSRDLCRPGPRTRTGSKRANGGKTHLLTVLVSHIWKQQPQIYRKTACFPACCKYLPRRRRSGGVFQIKIKDAELQSDSNTERPRRNMKETKRQQDKERENILPLCQYNIYANHAVSMCVNLIKEKKQHAGEQRSLNRQGHLTAGQSRGSQPDSN